MTFQRLMLRFAHVVLRLLLHVYRDQTNAGMYREAIDVMKDLCDAGVYAQHFPEAYK